ncbi:hypothetical protein DPMN_133495 [Dreissena polymorpha]|uniref:Uncharacterized protein n=1 Tax=Dreissena polymorpha TaxID=45954 RepID=A0A9D4FY08_DREPO|nr:hypothetical protein DPMN_133495 [Dreissena polymorpha]
MVVPANNRRLIESDDRQSTARCSTYCRAIAVHPSLHNCSSLDALSAPKTRSRRLPDNMRWYQDRLGNCWAILDSLRRFQTVSQTSWAPAGESKTVCDGAKVVWAPAGESQTVRDSLSGLRGTCKGL